MSNSTGLRRRSLANFTATYGGQWVYTMIRRNAQGLWVTMNRLPAGNNFYFTNGTYTDSTLGTTSPPDWPTASITSSFILVGNSTAFGTFRMSELTVWERFLSETETLSYYDTGLVPITPAAHYLFNEQRYLTSYDLSGNGLDLTHSVNTIWGNRAPITGVTSVSVTTANGVSGSVATATTTPAITITLGAITPTTIAATDTTNATTSTTGAVKTAGGLGVAKDLFVGGKANVTTPNGTAAAYEISQQGVTWKHQMDASSTSLSLYSGATKIVNVAATGGGWAYTPQTTGGSFIGQSTGGILNWAGATMNETFASGAQTKIMAYNLVAPTVTSTSAVTYANAYALFITAAPVASTNVTMTKTWSLGMSGGLDVGADLRIAGNATLTNALTVGNGGTGQTTFTNGQLLIGNTTGNTLTKATLTAGAGVTVTNSTGSITLTNTGMTALRTGTATLVAGTVTVSDASTAATTRIRLSMVTPGGTVGAQYVSAKTNSTSFVITSTNPLDTSVIYYEAFEP